MAFFQRDVKTKVIKTLIIEEKLKTFRLYRYMSPVGILVTIEAESDSKNSRLW